MHFVSTASTKTLLERLRESEKVYDIPLIAQIVASEAAADLNETESLLVAQYEDAGGPPLITDGKPTLIRFVAWMAHASDDRSKPYINANRLAFVKDDLEEAAKEIGGVNPLVMDWNHSAVRPWSEGEKVIGVWHSAKLEWNDKVEAWGILAQGVMFAWAFPDIANSMLADQERLGHVRFSMACISQSVEMTQDNDGYFSFAHKPVFFTLSGLDVPNADAAANGRGKEGSQDPELEEKLAKDLLAAHSVEVTPEIVSIADRLLAALKRADEVAQHPEPLLQVASIEENTMTPEEIAALTAANDASTARVTELEALLVETETRASVAETRITEVETARDAVAGELTTANEEITRLTGELETAAARLATIDAEEAAAAKEALVATRLASLPAAFQKAFAKKVAEAQTKLKNKWADMSDEEFSFYVSEELLVSVPTMQMSYLQRTEQENITALPVSQEGDDSVSARIARHKK